MERKDRYNDYSSYIKKTFGERAQKVSLDVGFTCPNRDGSKDLKGCTYCNNDTFSPSYCEPIKSVTQQLNEGIGFFSKKYKAQKYLAYFQAYSNTYGQADVLRTLYDEALAHPEIIGLVIGTRCDCVSEEIADLLESYAKKCYVSVEFGIESTLDKTLDRINRCHTFQETIDGYNLLKDRGIHLGGHMILGLPGETQEEILGHAARLNQLPLETLKIHQLQIVKHTMMAFEFKKEPESFQLFELDDYIELVSDFVTQLRPGIVIERFVSESPASLLIAPKWGLKNFVVTDKILKRLEEKDAWQGKAYTELNEELAQ
ncbi:MAG: TIGR01212 family radical SAM protein [Flavobacteriales bacterium]|nr:TIGR01212 family radical SAM protein [Flavobacteriales bacterium]